MMMMKKAWIVACVLLFSAAAGHSQAPSHAALPPQVLLAILGQPAATSACPVQKGTVALAALGSVSIQTTCIATCQSGSTISCPTGTTTCSAVNSACPSEPGHIVCNGVTTWCPACSTCASTDHCCKCAATSNCVECCLCDGFSGPYCVRECSP